jgi:hypothetical protein
MRVTLKTATDKDITETCAAGSDLILVGQEIVVCQDCKTVSHVACWNRLERCPGIGCPNVGRVFLPSKSLAVGVSVCPYCGESLPMAGLSQCPQCQEYVDPARLQEFLIRERYNRCPRGIKALNIWLKIQGAILMLAALAVFIPVMFQPRPVPAPWVGMLLASSAIALLGYGMWKVGDGLRTGKLWGRRWARILFWLQIVSLKGLIVGVICLATLESGACRAYFQELPQLPRGDV